MKKIFKGLMCMALACGMAIGCIPFAACGNNNDGAGENNGTGENGGNGGNNGGDNGNNGGNGGTNVNRTHDTETRTLQLALGAVDQKFNPLFYTAQNDGIIAGMTQVPLMTVDEDGKLAFGDSQATVALDYQETYYDSSMNAIGYGDGKSVSGSSTNDGYTTYEFVIKNGVKFSDGVDLTVMDVLFNLYVYLDPAYSGSSTIYSTKIVGLQAYRKQDKDASDNDVASDDSQYETGADERYLDLYDWSDGLINEETDEMRADKEWLFNKFKEELETDWNSIETSWQDNYKESYRFTAAWQAYMYKEGVVKKLTEKIGGIDQDIKDEEEKYLTTLDEYSGMVDAQQLIDDINSYVKDNGNPTDKSEILNLQKEFCINYVYEAYANRTGVKAIMEKWNAGAVDLYEYLVASERNKAHENMDESDSVYNVSGITVRRSDKLRNNYNSQEKDLGGEHDIVTIKIKGIDPKAKWNFSFAITPMHYYSDATYSNGGWHGDYYDRAMQAYAKGSAEGGVYSATCKDFGVKFDDRNWLDAVVATGAKNKLPIGAGPYKATSYRHDDSQPTGLTFFYNQIAYFERNTYFTTLGSGINNANIKYVNYKVLADDKIIEALRAGEVDYGTPIAKASNALEVAKSNFLDYDTYYTAGYGYVGINPKEVPDIEVRKAIMSALDFSWISDYYGTGYMKNICWPVSSTSWAYPNDSTKTRYYERIADANEIRALIASSGNWTYDANRGKIVSTANNPKGAGVVLSLTFTIAGESKDHPAFDMFNAAEVFLEECGMEISVMRDVDALLKLATGKLSVWAAAWSSSIDPDPYQIYSKNSEASSTKNWYKDGIYKDPTTYATEYAISEQLSELIEQGRAILDEDSRKIIYAQCYELIMQMAVECPTYQRKDMYVYNKSVIDANTFTADKGNRHLVGPIDKIWELNYV